jgi:hypothetical protein
MPFCNYDPATMKSLYAVFDGAWAELQAKHSAVPSLADAARIKMTITNNLLAAAACGERDPEQLKRTALDGVDPIHRLAS